MPLTTRESLALASRFRGIRPAGNGTENAERRTWADMVNATTACGAVPEQSVREFRQTAGWERELDAPVRC